MTCYYPNLIKMSKIFDEKSNSWKWGKQQITYNAQIENFENLFKKIENECDDSQKAAIVPCGTCIGCRLDQAKEWSQRMYHESKLHKENWFFTLTYDDFHKPYKSEYKYTWTEHELKYLNSDTGEIVSKDISDTSINTEHTYEKIYKDPFPNDKEKGWNGYIKKEDISLFMDKVRKHYRDCYNEDFSTRTENDRKYKIPGYTGIKFYAVGEYGSQTARPHFHAIIFNMPIDPKDLTFYKNDHGNILYTSDLFNKLWDYKGFVVIGAVTPESIDYVSRYCTKKLFGPVGKETYMSKGQTPECAVMSRRPGIGKAWYDQNKEEIYKYDKIELKKGKVLIRAKPSKYYDRLYDQENPKDMERLRELREEAMKEARKQKLMKTSVSYKEQLSIEERTCKAKLKSKREVEI